MGKNKNWQLSNWRKKMENPRKLHVFLCHSSQDKPAVRKLYRYLSQRGFKPWFDEVSLLPGVNWRREIEQALYKSDAILICLSRNSIDKEGYTQKEISFALDKALEIPDNEIFIIPVKLEECQIPVKLDPYQWVELFRPDGYKKLLSSLNLRAVSIGAEIGLIFPRKNKIQKEASTPTNGSQIEQGTSRFPKSDNNFSTQVIEIYDGHEPPLEITSKDVGEIYQERLYTPQSNIDDPLPEENPFQPNEEADFVSESKEIIFGENSSKEDYLPLQVSDNENSDFSEASILGDLKQQGNNRFNEQVVPLVITKNKKLKSLNLPFIGIFTFLGLILLFSVSILILYYLFSNNISFPFVESNQPTITPTLSINSTNLPSFDTSGEVPNGGLADEETRLIAWGSVQLVGIMSECTSPTVEGTTITVIQEPDASGIWREEWNVNCGDGTFKSFPLTFTPENGIVNVTVDFQP